jgi:hypothetical protein
MFEVKLSNAAVVVWLILASAAVSGSYSVLFYQLSQITEDIKDIKKDVSDIKVFIKDHERRITKLESK